MKITALNVPDGYLGLKELRLADLGSVVLLAGPNGAGKSRLLKCVAEFGGACLSEEERVAASVERANLRNSITTHEAHIANAISAGAAPDADWKSDVIGDPPPPPAPGRPVGATP